MRPALLARTRDLPERSLRRRRGGHGAASAGAHDVRYPISLVHWWQATNELHQFDGLI